MTAKIIPFRPRLKTVEQSCFEFWLAVWLANMKLLGML